MARGNLCFVTASLILAIAMPVFAEYTAIQGNLINGISDTGYDPDTGKLWIQEAWDGIELYDPGPDMLPGTITNGNLDVSTYLHSYDSLQQKAVFWGGNFSLTFDYDGIAREISGPITAMEFKINVYGPDFSTLDGEGLWKAMVKNLPGSGVWPDGGGKSGIDTLTLVFDQDLSDWNFGDDLHAAETIWSVIPSDSPVPEPATMILLAISAVGLLRRRSF